MTISATAQAALVANLSTASDSSNGNAASFNPSISSDGRYVVFESTASNLVAGDGNLSSDIFLVDTVNGNIERISKNGAGQEANGASNNPVISGNGQFVVFESFASNLVSGDTNRSIDIFMYDRLSDTMELISVDSAGTPGNSHSFAPSVSADGQFVAFYSMSTNLAPGDSNRAIDVFVRNRSLARTDVISVDVNGYPANMASWQPTISADGQYVAFASNATNLVAGDNNNVQDIFLYNRLNGTLSLLSKAADGSPANGASGYPAMSGNGNYIVFESDASNITSNDGNGTTDVFVVDLQRTTATRVSSTENGLDSNAPAYHPAISQDGRFITYYSYASNIVTPDLNDVEDVFIYDQVTGNKDILTRTMNGEQSNASSFSASLSADGRYVALSTLASNLDPMDTNDIEDVYLFDRGIVNTPPLANAGGDIDVVQGSSVTLDGSASSDPDGDVITGYQWRLESAPATSGLSGWTASADVVVFTPDSVGTYVISLVVSDGIAQSPADEVFINVSENLPPSALATADITEGYAPLSVQFDASQSTDPEGGTLLYDWDFTDGATASSASPLQVFSLPGIYDVQLTVTDNVGNTSQSTLRITVLSVNQPPVINSLTVTPTSGAAPLTVNLSLVASDADHDILTTTWDLGDGTVLSDTESATHVYQSPGIYTGMVTVSDGVNNVSKSFVISVGGSFEIKDTRIKLHINHRKPQHSKLKSWTRFAIDTMPSADDSVALILGDLEIMRLPMASFREIRQGLFVYKDRQLFVKLDFNDSHLSVLKRTVSAADFPMDAPLNIRLQIGDITAMEDIVLHGFTHCRRHDDDSEHAANCPTTIIKTVNTAWQRKDDHD